MKYDVVIIGSGLGGLECAYILSKEGYNVCLIEKNTRIGGCLHDFKRQGVLFDSGVHYIGCLGEGHTLNSYFKYFNLLPKLKIKSLDTNAFDKICFENDEIEYNYANGKENFIRTLTEYFPKEKQTLNKYISTLQKITNNIPLYNFKADVNGSWSSEYLEIGAKKYIDSLTNNQKLRNVLAGLNILYAGESDRTPLYEHGIINRSFIESAFQVVGGSFQIAEILSEQILKNGGTILKNCKAEKFNFNDKYIKSVVSDSGYEIRAKRFISGIHPSETLKLISSDKIKKTYTNRIINLKNTTAAFTLHCVIKRNTLKQLNSNYFYYREKSPWINNESKNWPQSYFLSSHVNSESDKYAESISIISYMEFDKVMKWADTIPTKRGEDYDEFKKYYAEKLLDTIENKFPDIRNHIKKYYCSTPLTYQEFTGTPQGSMYGIQKDYKNPYLTYISAKTKIPNLFFTGQNVSLHGVLGVTLSSFSTCSEFLGLEYLINKVKKF